MLRVENICKTFFAGTINEKKALQGLSLHLKPGDFVTVIGGNGAGKSTLMNSIAGVFPIDSGKIIIDGNDITKTPEHKRAKYIGRVFQDPMMGTAAGMMIEENLAIAARRGKTPGLKWGLDSDNQTWFSELVWPSREKLKEIWSRTNCHHWFGCLRRRGGWLRSLISTVVWSLAMLKVARQFWIELSLVR